MKSGLHEASIGAADGSSRRVGICSCGYADGAMSVGNVSELG